MKILHLLYESKGDYFGIGGVGIRAYEIYKYLKDRHDITLLCKRYPKAKDGEIEGLRHIFVGTESSSLTKTLLSYAYHSAQFVKRHGDEYDLIIEDFSPAIPTFLHAFTKRPVILQIQGYTGFLYFRKYNPLYALFLFFMEHLRPRFYKDFIFVNRQTAKKLFFKTHLADTAPNFDRLSGSPDAYSSSNQTPLQTLRERIDIIPNGISQELLNVTPQEGDYILYLGRIDIYGKGLDTLIRAYKEFHKSFPHIRLVVAGDGRDMESFKAAMAKLPVNILKKIELLGWVSGQNKTEVIRNALFCIFPSRHEVQPIANLEAVACGKAVIVSDIPEFHHIVQVKVGMSFRTGDAISLAQAMKDMMMSNQRLEMGTRGRNYVKDFTWDRIAQKYEEFLNKSIT